MYRQLIECLHQQDHSSLYKQIIYSALSSLVIHMFIHYYPQMISDGPTASSLTELYHCQVIL